MSGPEWKGPSDHAVEQRKTRREGEQLQDTLAARKAGERQGKAMTPGADALRFADHDVTVQRLSKEMFSKEQRDSLKSAGDRAVTNTINCALEVSRAIRDFESYTQGRIEELEGQVSAGELALGLADAALKVLAPAERLASGVATDVGKRLVGLLYERMNSDLQKSIGDAMSKDADDLKKVVSKLAKQADDRAASLRKTVEKEVVSLTRPIRDRLERGERLGDEDEIFLAEVFMGESIGRDNPVDAALFKRGFPNPDRAYADVLGALVTEFEQHYIKASASYGELALMAGSEWDHGLEAPGGVLAAARKKADQYVIKRLRERAAARKSP